MDKEALKLFVYWIKERESIRLKKEVAKEPKPWTDDKILQSYRFTNVIRQDDKVSRWLWNNWYKPNLNHRNLLVAATLARHFNQPSALARITDYVFGTRYQPDKIKTTMRRFKAEGQCIFNGAYMVRGIGAMDKTEMVVDRVCQPLYDDPPQIDDSSMENTVNALLPRWGIASFMAGQIVADLRWAITGPWKDRRTWAPMGPGSQRGMNRLHSRPIKSSINTEQWEFELSNLALAISSKIPMVTYKRMEAIDLQNCCCEFDKYLRTLNGEGKPKQRYPGTTDEL